MGVTRSVGARVGAALVVGLLSGGVWVTVDAGPALAGSMSLSPNVGPPGISVGESGTWPACPGGGLFTFVTTFDGVNVASGAAPAGFSGAPFTVPAFPPGPHSVVTTVMGPPAFLCTDSESATFTIPAPPPPMLPPPTSPPPRFPTESTTTTTETTTPPTTVPATTVPTTVSPSAVVLRTRLTSNTRGATSSFVILLFFVLIGIGLFQLRRSLE